MAIVRNEIRQIPGVGPIGITGSRFMGTDTAASDWDLFMPDTRSSREYLERSGFWPIPVAGDGNMQAVYRKLIDSRQVDVQLVKDFRRRAMSNAIVRNTPLCSLCARMPKPERKKIWRIVNAIVRPLC